jgi:hypothetical protein
VHGLEPRLEIPVEELGHEVVVVHGEAVKK